MGQNRHKNAEVPLYSPGTAYDHGNFVEGAGPSGVVAFLAELSQNRAKRDKPTLAQASCPTDH